MEETEFNFFEEKALDQISLAELDGMVKRLFDYKKEIESMQDAIDSKQGEMDSLKETIKSVLEAHNKPNYPTQYGMVYTQKKFQVSFPKDPVRAAQLRAYFAKRGMDDLLTVNHMSLNSIFNSIVAEKETLGEEVNLKEIIPGVEEPTARVVLAMKKGK